MAITQKLVSLPFQKVQHEIITVDNQPTASGGIMVFICGNLKVYPSAPTNGMSPLLQR